MRRAAPARRSCGAVRAHRHSKLDDLLDRVRPTDLVRRLLAWLGVG